MFISYMATSCFLGLRSRFNLSSLFIAFCILPLIDSGYALELTPAAGVERWNSHIDQHKYKVFPDSDMNYDNKDTAPVQDIQIDSNKPCKTNVELKVLKAIFEILFGSNHTDVEDNDLYEVVIISILCYCGLEIIFALFLCPIFLIVFFTGHCFRINIVIGPICQCCRKSNELNEKTIR